MNGSAIATFGQKEVTFHFGNRHTQAFTHKAIIADVNEPIVGWDMLEAFHLSLHWAGHNCFLQDETGGRYPLKMRTTRQNALGLSLISFKKYAQEANRRAGEKDGSADLDGPYKAILADFPDVLKVNFTNKPKHGVTHHIDTADHPPCKARLRPLMHGSPREVAGKKAWLELERLGIVERIKPGDPTTWSSALHLAPKCDGTLRPCGDYRALNSKTVLDTFPLPNIRHFVAKLKGATLFSKVDLLKSYHQIPLSKSSSNKTTLLTPWGVFKFKRLAMGLRNAAQSFQKVMNHVLEGLPNVFCYLDDILIWSSSISEHQKTIRELMGRLSDAGLTISLKKCQFQKTELEFLGFKVNAKGITPLPRKVEAITRFPPPSKPKDLLGFLGAVNYYRRSLPNLEGQPAAEVLRPLYQAATNRTPGKTFTSVWHEQGLQAHFDRAKDLLVKACQLTFPDPNAPLALVVDASKVSVGGCLEQLEDGKWRPLGYWSKQLKPNEVSWSTFRRELLAVQQGIRHFMEEINGRHLVVYSDHLPLISAFKSPSSMAHDPIATNHLLEVSMWTNDIRHIKGRLNAMADTLSRPSGVPLGAAYRLPSAEERPLADDPVFTAPAVSAVALETMDPKQLAFDQGQCPEVTAHVQGKHAAGLVIRQVEFIPGTFLICDVSNGKKARPLVPKPHRDLLIRLFHNLTHPGQKETLRRLGERYYWPDMKKDVSNYVSRCHGCLSCKPHKQVRPSMDSRPVLQPRFRDVQLDIVGPLPVSEGHKYLLTIVDRTSRWFEALPLVEATAKNCATAFIRGWIRHFGLPSTATSDNGNVFISRVWKELQRSLGTIIKHSPLYSPSSVGSIERQHLDLKVALRAALLEMGDVHGANWMSMLPWVLLGRRTSYHSELQATPAQAVFGEDPRVPGDLTPEVDLTADQDVPALLQRVRDNAQRPPAQTRRPNLRPRVTEAASTATHVYILRPKKSPLGPIYDGPFPILSRLGKSCLQIDAGPDAQGQQRLEVRHWRDCHPVTLPPDTIPATRPRRGRPASDNSDKP